VTPRQCEIAAESYVASLFARAGFDVLVQYGANQPHYDLVAEKGGLFLPISVKGSQDGGWMLAVKYKTSERTYHQAADAWLAAQKPNLIYAFVQFMDVAPADAPRVYLAKPPEIADQLKTQRDGKGYGSLQEDRRRARPGSKYSHAIPAHWKFSQDRLHLVAL
jgi:Holliday junction resolvase-like predicted endonuclease